MTELELRLTSLRGEIDWPETPSFELAFERVPARRPLLRPLAIGLAVLLAALGAVLALSPGARSAFLELFRLKGATVELVETLPPADVQAPDFGERVSRSEAEQRVGFELLDLGEPDAVFVRDNGMASLVYGPVEQPQTRPLAAARRCLGRLREEGRRRAAPASRRSRSAASAASSSQATITTSCSSARTTGCRTSRRSSPARSCSGTAVRTCSGSKAT